MSYLAWNINYEALKGLCISTAFLRSDWTNETSIEDMVSFFFDKEISEFKSTSQLIEAFESHPLSKESVEYANDYLNWVFNNEPPAGISISTFEFYDALFDLDDLFEE
jgi:hypothetical protein